MDESENFLLDCYLKQVAYKFRLISDEENELHMLYDELQMLKAVLKDAPEMQKKGEAFKEGEKQIRKLIYEVEDCIDDAIAARNAVGMESSHQRTSLVKQVKYLRNSIREAKINFQDYLLTTDVTQESEEQEIVQNWRSEKPMKKHIVGLEDETETIINYLKQDSEKLEVISIIGMGGLGKTTLAWKIFQDPGIHYEFPVRIWVTVSEKLNRKDVFLTILKEFTHQKLSMSDDELASRVKERLYGEKFLIILDNVWTLEAWDQIKAALPMENGMGKVLITTCMGYVAIQASPTRPPHQLRFLDEKESWELLQYEVYDALEAVDKELVNVGKVIAKNCNGLPLTIVVIARILSEKIATAEGSTRLIRKEWDKVSVNVEDHLINGDREGRMLKTIAVSYSKLPDDLRNCFLYLGMFPKSALIPTRQLTRLWIAEGFIQPKPGYSLEEIALDNLKDLISRSLVMVQETKLDGEVKTCRVHNAIREFCKDEASSEKGNLFQEIKMNEKEGLFEPKLANIKEYRRISIHSYVPHLFSQNLEIPTRSFLCFPDEPINLRPTDIASVIESFSLLRVFAAKKIKFPCFPFKMTKLTYLRYLTMSVAYELKVLPDPIFYLRNLQTLIVETLSSTLEIKANIWKMMQLRHFKTRASITLTCRNGTGQGGQNLQTFGRLSPESCTDGVFSKAKNLNALAIRGELSKLLLQSNCLEKLDILKKLKLEHDASENPLYRLPQPEKFPCNLTILTLTGTYLSWAEMTIVGKLHCLEVLKLKENAFMGESWDVNDNGFYKLKFMYIEYTDLVFWTTSDHAFPGLTSLTLKNCEALKEVPYVLGKTLEMLSLECVTPTAVSSAKKIEQLANQKNLKVQRRGFKLVIGG